MQHAAQHAYPNARGLARGTHFIRVAPNSGKRLDPPGTVLTVVGKQRLHGDRGPTTYVLAAVHIDGCPWRAPVPKTVLVPALDAVRTVPAPKPTQRQRGTRREVPHA